MAFSLPFFLSLVSSFVLLQFSSHVLAYTKLSDNSLRSIPSPRGDMDPHFGSLLAPILVPRIPGTPNHANVQQHFVTFFQRELPTWKMEWQNSTARTPISDKDLPFANMIFKREPPWAKPGETSFLTLVAHYDSKYRPLDFIGATDSAAPCAIIMHVARVIEEHMQHLYDNKKASGQGNIYDMDMGVEIVLLDGEEAFVNWTDDDSLYGSRALAEGWSASFNQPSTQFHKFKTPLSQISLFVLLDLLGSAQPRIPSYFSTTHWAYQHLADIEQRMRFLGILESNPTVPWLPDADKAPGMVGGISDDHLPFMGMGVEILHLIPYPFPKVWHRMEDNGDNLDLPTVRDWSRLVAAFVLEWLDVEGGE